MSTTFETVPQATEDTAGPIWGGTDVSTGRSGRRRMRRSLIRRTRHLAAGWLQRAEQRLRPGEPGTERL